MATFRTPFVTPPQSANKKELFITLGIIAALVVGTLGYYFWPKSAKTDEIPPSITIASQRFQGLISGDVVCQIPGLYEFTDSAVSSYKMPGPDGDLNWNNLEQGIHMYHSIQPINVKEVIDAIKPVAGNKIMIAYYPSDDGNISKKFAIYPELPDQTKITDPASYLIPGDQGFAIFSCKDTKIWQVKTEKMSNNSISGLLNSKTKGWILLAATDQPLATSLAAYKNKIKSIWLQKDAGFEFQKAASLESATLVGDYKMVWLKVGPEEAAPAKPANQIACEKKCGTCIPGSLTNSYVCSNLPWGSGITGYSCYNGISGGTQCIVGTLSGYNWTSGFNSGQPNYCNPSGGYYNYSGCLNSKFNSGSGYYSGKLVQDQPASQPSGSALSPKISVTTSVASSSAQTSTIDFTYTITGPTTSTTNIVWTWGDGQTTTNKTGILAAGQTLTAKQSHIYSTSQKVYNYSAALKNPDNPNITLAITSDTINITGATNEKQTIASLSTKIGNHFSGTGIGTTEVIFNYRVNGDYLKPFDKVIWDFGDGQKKTDWGNTLFVNSDEKIGHSYSNPGTYNYSLTLQDDKGAEIAKKTGTVILKNHHFNIKPDQINADYCYIAGTNPYSYEIKWQKPLSKPNQGSIFYRIKSDDYKSAIVGEETSSYSAYIKYEDNQSMTAIAEKFNIIDGMTVVAVDEGGQESLGIWKTCINKPTDSYAPQSYDQGVSVN